MGNANDHGMARDRKYHRLAIASVVLGAAAVGCGLALALLVGHGAHLRPTYRGALWNAMWGWRLLPPAVVLAALTLLGARWAGRGAGGAARLLAIASLVLALWPWLPRRGPYHHAFCLSNMKNLSLAVQMYVTDYGRFAPSPRWGDATVTYINASVGKQLYRCPDRPEIFGYAYNAALGGFPTAALAKPARLPVIFESDGGWNAHGGKELLPSFPRHLGGDNIGFPDGHAKWYARQKPRGEVRWDTVWPREYQNRDELQWQPAPRREAR